MQKINDYLERRFNEVRESNGTIDNGDESLPEIDWKKNAVELERNVEILLKKIKNGYRRKEGQGRKQVC